MANIGNLSVSVGADTSGLSRGLSEAQRGMTRFNSHAGGVIRRLSALTAAFGLSTGAVTAMVRNTMGLIDEQAKLARGLGGSTAALQALDRAAGRAGVSSGELQSATLRLNQRLGQAVIEGGAAADALGRIGLRADDLINMDIDERMATLSDAMRDAGLNSQQMAFTLRELGIRQSAIVNLMQEGGDAIRDSRRAVEDFGLAVSEVDAAAIERANDAVDEIGIAITGVRNRIAVELSPVITQIAEHIGNRFREAGQDISDSIGRAADFAIGKFADILDGAARAVEFINQNPMMAQFGILGYILLGPKGALIGGVIGAAFDQIRAQLESFGVTLSDAEFQGQRLASMEQELARASEVVNMALEQRNRLTDEAERAEFSRAIGLQELIDQEIELKDEISALRSEVELNEDSMNQFDRAMARAEGTSSSLGNEMRGVADAIRAARNASEGMEGPDGERGGASAFLFDPDGEAATAAAEAQQKELDQTREHLERRLEMLREGLMDQQELEQHRHEQRLEELQEMQDHEVITAEEHQRLMEEMTSQHLGRLNSMEERAAQDRARIQEQEARARQQVVDGMMNNLVSLMNSGSRQMFNIGKVAAVAQALLAGREAIVSSYAAGARIGGPPLGAAYAATAAAATAAQIASVRSTSFSGGGSTSSGGAAGGSARPTDQLAQRPQEPERPRENRVANINLVGENFSRRQVANLIEQINDLEADGMRTNLRAT